MWLSTHSHTGSYGLKNNNIDDIRVAPNSVVEQKQYLEIIFEWLDKFYLTISFECEFVMASLEFPEHKFNGPGYSPMLSVELWRAFIHCNSITWRQNDLRITSFSPQ